MEFSIEIYHANKGKWETRKNQRNRTAKFCNATGANAAPNRLSVTLYTQNEMALLVSGCENLLLQL